mmetsp:Transcript_9496/g.15558  ORF Transcript_9496/g.15558 Transcript_9496/m.15558 type:complete len:916 (-) Transcript_9496:66-2813(-)|eukprot:CAMPEP_0203789356 /NCGR_PEP_ID=MMETSP0100_2-20121128/3377_1 /ASSEMBLY_ACC=CAM_ASM_000210 /TAXON_ID=96639 /ORGANISM=" , Strain NY0313808BC1" /LENGTH=915 /DNA_ID=CAMNT_0050692241 /DNA_START=200 /DNA_END=2947 /DNA_ORIENTATION=-
MRTVAFTPKRPVRETRKGNENRMGSGRRSSWTYYDDAGHGPFRRFLRPDNPEVVYPTRRIVMFLFLGSCLSTVGVQLSADEYYEGPHRTFIQYHRGNTTEFPVHIAFNNVGCSISGMHSPILSNMTGEIRPGKLTGIMGQSGSGKTTFAYTLLGRAKRYCTNGAHGTVYLNGRPRDLETFLDRVGFVPQDDVLYPDLTVEEALTFSASWRLPRHMTVEERRKVVHDTLRTLDLEKIRDRRIGDVKQRSISGGERKRTSIGMELVSLPDVLVMDEPTSGLDSAGTYQLMLMLKRVAERGVSVVTVIHQPSGRIFNLMDDLILMQDGEAAYVGPRDGAVPFLSKMGYAVPDTNATPSPEFILDVLARLEMPVKYPENSMYERVCRNPMVDSESENLTKFATESDCMSRTDNLTHPILPALFRQTALEDKAWDKIEEKMTLERREEDVLHCMVRTGEQKYELIRDILDDTDARERQLQNWKSECEQLSPEALRRRLDDGKIGWGVMWSVFGWLGMEQCGEGDSRMWCTMLDSRTTFPSYQQLPKPGLKRQVNLWFWQIMGLKWRRGLAAEVSVIVSLALVVAFVRSFNTTWNRRAVSNLFLSISIGLLGMVGAVFHDDIAPVQRAASAGMLLGAHEFAVLAESIVWGWCVCHMYTLAYFFGLWIRNGIWILNVPTTKNSRAASFFDFTYWVRLQKYYEFAHLLHLNYLASGALGSAICVISNHDTSASYVAAVALLITCHVFAFFTPNRNQIKHDCTIFGTINLAPAVERTCSLSYVRYFMEAAYLWSPVDSDANGRKYVMRYFGYVDSNKTHCATSLFSLWTIAQAARFLIFGFRNSNDFHSLYDTPLFLIFIFKVLSCHVVALLIMTLIQETYYPMLEKTWARLKDDDVDIVSLDSRSSTRMFHSSYPDYHFSKDD